MHVWNAIWDQATVVRPPDQSVTAQQDPASNACKIASALILLHTVYQEFKLVENAATQVIAAMGCFVVRLLLVILAK